MPATFGVSFVETLVRSKPSSWELWRVKSSAHPAEKRQRSRINIANLPRLVLPVFCATPTMKPSLLHPGIHPLRFYPIRSVTSMPRDETFERHFAPVYNWSGGARGERIPRANEQGSSFPSVDKYRFLPDSMQFYRDGEQAWTSKQTLRNDVY